MNCPNHHVSTSSDYCSVCGVKIGPDAEPDPAGEPGSARSGAGGESVKTLSAGSNRICPKCQTSQLDPNGQFCENCGHKLDQPVPEASVPSTNTPVTQVAAQPVTNAPAASNTSRKTSATSLDPASANRSGVGWRLEYRIAEEVANPPSASELILKNRISLIGRTSPRRNLHPEIACDWDDAVSHRHAQIELDTDGNANLTDLGSVNGTMLNGKAITPNIPVKLNDGDRISLGAKTALVVHAPTADVVVTNTV